MCIVVVVFFVSLLVAAIWGSILWTGTATGSTESPPSESECLLWMGGEGTRRYIHGSKDAVSGSHGSRAVKQVCGCVVCLMTTRAGRADVLINSVQIGPQIPVMPRTQPSQFNLVPSALYLLFLGFRYLLVEGLDVTLLLAARRFHYMALNEGDNAIEGGGSAGTANGASGICCLVSNLIPLDATMARHPLDPNCSIAGV